MTVRSTIGDDQILIAVVVEVADGDGSVVRADEGGRRIGHGGLEGSVAVAEIDIDRVDVQSIEEGDIEFAVAVEVADDCGGGIARAEGGTGGEGTVDVAWERPCRGSRRR